MIATQHVFNINDNVNVVKLLGNQSYNALTACQSLHWM